MNGPADITNAGGLSPYGTMGQSGNVNEWMESGLDAPNDSASEVRARRSGMWNDDSSWLISSDRTGSSPTVENFAVGFRVASVPEPSAFLLTLIGTLGVVLRRKRG